MKVLKNAIPLDNILNFINQGFVIERILVLGSFGF